VRGMKRFLLVASVAAFGVVPAIAADVNVPPPSSDPLADFPIVYQPPPVRVFTWTGCYAGIHAGGASADNQFNGQFSDTVIPTGVNATPPSATSPGSVLTALAAAGYNPADGYAPTGNPHGGWIPIGVDPTLAAPGKGFISSNGIDVGTAGVLGGAQAGCDLQFAKHWVVGFSADAAGANIQGSTAQTNSFGLIGPLPVTTSVNSSGSLNAQTNFIATLTGRFGYSMGPGLFYVKGGGAYERSSYSFSGNVASTSCNTLTPIVPFVPTVPPSPPPPPPIPSCAISNPTVNQQFNFGTSTDSRFGWTIGIGTEWMVYGGLSVFGEYNYLDFGTRSVTFSDPTLGPYPFNVTQHFNVFKLGVNYRFGVEGDPYRSN